MPGGLFPRGDCRDGRQTRRQTRPGCQFDQDGGRSACRTRARGRRATVTGQAAMSRSLVGVVLVALALYLGVGVLLLVFQRSLIYFPQPRAIGGPDRQLMLPVTDEQIVVTVRPLASSRALIYFGGNAEDVSRSLPD